MKKKILFCTESGQVNSGYGNYTRSLLTRLYDTHKYDIAELSCYRTVTTVKKEYEKWKIYPNAVEKKDDRYGSYISNFPNQFGQWRFDLVVADFKPDIVVDFRDAMMSVFQRASIFRNKFHWLLAPTIDSFPIRLEWVDCMKNCDTLLTHTDWSKERLESDYSINVCGVAKDSIDTNIFRPINKIPARQKHQVPIDAFILGSVMRNQKRKLIPELMYVFSQLKQQHDNLYLYLHTSYPETQGWDIPELLLRYRIADRVLFTYVCQQCKNWKPMLWKGEKTICHKCGEQKMVLAQVSHGLNEKDLCEVYNIFDLYIQYSICEGFGIPPLEAASCGIPFVTVDHGAMRELCLDFEGCRTVDIKSRFTEQESSAIRVLPDNDACVKIINDYIAMDPIKLLSIKNNIREKVLSKHSWDNTTKVFENIFDDIRPLSYKRWKPIPDAHFNKINKSIPNINNNRQFVHYILDNILEEPSLKNSFFIEQMIKALDIGYIVGADNKSEAYNRESAKKILEIWFNNKKMLNIFLHNRGVIQNKDFLNY